MTTAIVPATSNAITTTTADFAPVTYTDAGSNPPRVYLASLSSEESNRTMTKALDTIAAIATGGTCDLDSMPWHELRAKHTTVIVSQLAARYNHRTTNKHLSALRQVIKWSWRLEYMTAEDWRRAVDFENIKGETPDQAEAGRALELGEFKALVAACNDGTAAGTRDAAILGVGYACGLRRSEIAGLTVADFDAKAGALTVRGKGNKTRIVPIANGAKAALLDWLAIRGDTPGAMFLRIRKGDRLTDAGLTSQAIYSILQSRADAAAVDDFTPHDLRRTYAGDLLDAGADIVTVQKLMGHANTTTTSGYDRRGNRAKQEAAAKLHFPYTGRS